MPFFWPMIAPAIEEKGYKVIGFWENGIRHITNNVKPINTPADLDGLKIRTPKSTWRVKMFSAWGANPTPMAFSEVFVGLQTGVIDGQENPYTNIAGAKLNEVQKYLSVTGHVYTPFLSDSRSWPVGTNCRPTCEPFLRILPATYRAGCMPLVLSDEMSLREKLGETMEVNVADRASFVEASNPIYEEFAKEVPDRQADDRYGNAAG